MNDIREFMIIEQNDKIWQNILLIHLL